MPPARDTVVFVPAWNEEANLPAVLDGARDAVLPRADVLVIDDGSTDATADVARAGGAIVVSFGENRGPASGDRRRLPRGGASAATRTADASTPTASTRRTSSPACWSSSGQISATSRSDRDSRRAKGTTTSATCRRASRRFGIGLLQKAMHVRLGRPFHDPTSGMAAVNAKAMPVMARPYVSGAPEVEALLRLKAEGLRVEEVAVHMRERASGESKLQGKKALKLVLTVIGTLLFFRWLRRRGS